MKIFHITLVGTRPLLMNRYRFDDKGEPPKRPRVESRKLDEIVAESAYIDPEHGCYIPAEWLESMLAETAKGILVRRKSMRPVVMASVHVLDTINPLGKSTWDAIDRRPVRMNHVRVVRMRPRFDSWQVSFRLQVDDRRLSAEQVRMLLEEGGTVNGLGDFRPRFGQFRIGSFEEQT